MSESKQQWTPGPWSVDGEGAKAMVRDATGRIVAVRHRLGTEENEFAMNRIASVPDLIEALSETVSILQLAALMVEGKEAREMVKKTLAKARAALAKAGA
ncbi:hypothetical protein [Burkholderia glumae]